MSNKLIVIEGLDGSGKSTQVNKIRKYFETNGIDYIYYHFPRTDTPIFGDLIARFLQGEFGDVNQVNPYLVSLIYAGDRNEMKDIIREHLSNNKIVLLDRYVHSNIAFQCAKLNTEAEKEKLCKWILDMEFNYYDIPEPDLSVFLHVPFEFISKQLNTNRAGGDRSYLSGKDDIHEKSLDLQKKVEIEYLKLTETIPDTIKIDCFSESGEMIHSDIIHNRILEALKMKKII